jgi:flavodoxin
MKSLVVYFSKGGKTRKVAEAIAQELSCQAIDVKKKIPDISAVNLLVVGSGNYGGKPGKELQEFLENLQSPSKINIAFFATSGGPEPKCIKVMQEIVESKGFIFLSEFDCRGKMFLLNRGHPTQDDLRNAKLFAKKLKELIDE